MVSFGPEANGGWYTWGRQPVNYVKAFRYVHGKLGTGGITWLWQVSSITTADPTPYWPGSAYVDWAGLDGYYYVPSDNIRYRGSALAWRRSPSSGQGPVIGGRDQPGETGMARELRTVAGRC